MALRRLVKNSLQVNQKTQAIRGAHGWPRPDVPIDFSYQYVHKREISVYDLNCWYYDHTQPEYMFTWNEQHLEDHFGALQEMGRQFPLIWALMIGLGFFYYGLSNSRTCNTPYAFIKDQQIQHIQDLYTERKALQRNWLGLALNGENGTFYANYDVKDGVKERNEQAISDAAETVKINEDGKNFIINVVNATTAELQKKSA